MPAATPAGRLVNRIEGDHPVQVRLEPRRSAAFRRDPQVGVASMRRGCGGGLRVSASLESC